MIINFILVLIFFLWGITDASLGLSIAGYTIFLGFLVYISIFVSSRKTYLPTLFGFFYFLGLGSNMVLIGLMPLVIIGMETAFLSIRRYLITDIKIMQILFTSIFFVLDYVVILFIFDNFKLVIAPKFFINLLILAIIGGVISFFTKYKYER